MLHWKRVINRFATFVLWSCARERARRWRAGQLLAAAAVLSVAAIDCGTPESERDQVQRTVAPAAVARSARDVVRAAATETPSTGQLKSDASTLPHAEATFREVLGLIRERYVDQDLTDDQLWSAALRGVLQALIQVRGPGEGLGVNALLSPRDLQELKLGIQSRLSGIGVVIRQVPGATLVLDVLPGGAAAAAGIQAGDRILTIDGQRVSGMRLDALVDLIRGPAGSRVALEFQRETREWVVTLTRGEVHVEHVRFELLRDVNAGYLRIASFAAGSAARLSDGIGELLHQGATALVLDLRYCPGGMLDEALAAAALFLHQSDTIVTIERRGRERQVRRADRDGPAAGLPVVVLISPRTASGAEVLASALLEQRGAVLIGETSRGKGSVEEVFKLQTNAWAVKLSVGRLFSPQGHPLHGAGLTPTLLVPVEHLEDHTVTQQLNLDQDPQVQAARGVLRLLRGAPSRAAATHD